MSDAGEKPASFRIDIGPLRARWKQVGFGLLCLCLTAYKAAFAMRETRLDCLRELGRKPLCVLTESAPLPRVSRYPPGSIAAINVVRMSAPKGKPYWEVMILDLRGAQESVVDYGDQASAEDWAARVRAFLADPRALRFSFVPPQNWRAFLYLAFGLGIFLLLSWHAFRDTGHLWVDVDRLHGELRVRRRLFGISLGKQARYALSELRDIEIEYGEIKDPFAVRGQPLQKGARLSAVRTTGHRFPLTPSFLASPHLFETGLELLRDELGFAPRNESDVATASPASDPPNDAEAARGAPEATPSSESKKLPRADKWLLGFCVLAVVAAGDLLASRYCGKTDGWLEVRAEYRCVFDSMEMLPGGVMSMSLAAGRYQVHVFNSALEGNWEVQYFDVRAGESTVVICRPRQRAKERPGARGAAPRESR